MKKNYIAPNTEMVSFASQGLMQNPNIGFNVGSAGSSISDKEAID